MQPKSLCGAEPKRLQDSLGGSGGYRINWRNAVGGLNPTEKVFLSLLLKLKQLQGIFCERDD